MLVPILLLVLLVKNSRKLRPQFVAFLFSAFVGASASQAMSVEPLVLEVTSLGKGSTQSFQVSNNGATPLPVEITVAKIEIGPEGELRYEKAGDDFLIYPPQTTIAKGAAQTFRVQWIGDPDLKSSRNHRFAVAQVPLKLPKDTSGIQMTMSFGVIVSVSGPQAKASLIVTGVAPAKGEDGKRIAAIKVKNPGNKYGYFGQASIKLSSGGWSAQMNAHEVGQKLGLGIVQPGKERRFLLPVEVPGNVSDITASIDYQPEK